VRDHRRAKDSGQKAGTRRDARRGHSERRRGVAAARAGRGAVRDAVLAARGLAHAAHGALERGRRLVAFKEPRGECRRAPGLGDAARDSLASASSERARAASASAAVSRSAWPAAACRSATRARASGAPSASASAGKKEHADAARAVREVFLGKRSPRRRARFRSGPPAPARRRLARRL
jgi:hypothetical protein